MGRWKFSEAEMAFNEEVREKKKAANGVHSKTGKRGYVGVMRMPNEIMSRKDKYNYRRNGKVRTYRMIMTFEDFKLLDKEARKEFLEGYLKEHTKTQLKTAWGGADVYYYLQQAGLHTPEPQRRVSAKMKTAAALEEERKEIVAIREKMEEDILTAFTAADEAKKELAGLRAEFNIMRQHFKQTIDEIKSQYETGMKTAHIMLEEQEKEMQQLKEYARSMDDSYIKLAENSAAQEKEIAALREELRSAQTATDEGEQIVLKDELKRISEKLNNDFSYFEHKFAKVEGLTSITAAPTLSNELHGKIKGLEIDVTLLKQLAIK